MSLESNKSVVRKWIEQGWNKHNVAVIDETYASNFVQHGGGPDVNSADELKTFVADYFKAFPNLTFTIDDLVAEGDRVVWRFVGTATHNGPLMGIPASGRTVAVPGIVVFRMANDRIAEGWVNLDMLGMLQGIGAIPVAG